MLTVLGIVAMAVGFIASVLQIADKLPRWLPERKMLRVAGFLFAALFLGVLVMLGLSFRENEKLQDARQTSADVATKYEAPSMGFYDFGEFGEIIGTAIAVSIQLGDCFGDYTASLRDGFSALPPAAGFDFDSNEAYELARQEYQALAGFGLAFLESVAAGRVRPC